MFHNKQHTIVDSGTEPLGLQNRCLMPERRRAVPFTAAPISPSLMLNSPLLSCWRFSINQMSTNILDSLYFNLFNISKVLKELGTLFIST